MGARRRLAAPLARHTKWPAPNRLGHASSRTLHLAGECTGLSRSAAARLQQQLATLAPSERERVLAQFWRDIETHGAPLQEAATHPEERLVTFLWRAPTNSRQSAHCIRLDWAVRTEAPVWLQRLPGTDIWAKTLTLPLGFQASYQFNVDPPAWPAAAPNTPTRQTQAQTLALVAQRDALNPHHWSPGVPHSEHGAAAKHQQRSLLHIPAPAVTLTPAADAPLRAGALQHLRFHSQQLNNTRSLSLYLPHGDAASSSLPWVLLFDREAYLRRTNLVSSFDQWQQQNLLPPMALLLVANPTQADRALELPPLGPAFGEMLVTELLPWLRQQFPALSADPAQVVVAGSSYGGLAAGWLGWSQPAAFGNVLSLSGSYWWSPPGDGHRWTEGDWLIQQIAAQPARPVRWHLSYGLLETGVQGHGGIVDNNRHLRNVLQARGYAVTTQEYAGGHDYYVWPEQLRQGLQTLLAPAHSP